VIEVRPAALADVPGILAVHAQVAAEGTWIGTEVPVDTARFTRLFSETIESNTGRLFVACDGERVIGNLGVHPVMSGVLGLGMSIVPEHRGQGVGTQLMAAAIAWARSQESVHKLELEVWPHNAAAQALYRKLGFVVEGRRRRHYRRRNGELWDAIVMGLVLDETSPGSSLADA
jgi:RimJ/RimL family protein N-acetyltransferase